MPRPAANNYEITPQDIEQSLAKQKLRLQPGDAIILHTGYCKLWGKDNARYAKGGPGIGKAGFRYLKTIQVVDEPERNV